MMINLSNATNQIKDVSNFKDLVTIAFQDSINAICWKRKLIGDFSEIVKKIEAVENITILNPEKLNRLQLSKNGNRAREILINDWKLLEDKGFAPALNLIKYYDKDDSYPLFPTDVYSFHVDRSPIPSDTFLCTYHGESSEILPNVQAVQKVLVPEIRAALKKLHDGPEEAFELFLAEFFFDLHYQTKPDAHPISLGLGHMWRLAIDHPESKVPPCIHRAPKEKPGEYRLLMIC